MTRLVLPTLLTAVLGSTVAGQSVRRPLAVPDIPGYITLKGDFHLHSVFSDGEVWPTVHVREAWRDGLDVIALTDHIEYRPHKADVAGGPRRAYEIARPLAEQLGLLLVPGAEITRPVPGTPSDMPVGSAHFNVLFASDPDALDTPELTDALQRAKAQGAFVIWDHPGFMDAPARWFPHIGPFFTARLFSGIEVVNGDRFYPEALGWCRERELTPIASSDAHLPMPAHLKSARRPVTLVFAKTRDVAGVKEALVSRRTLAWLDTAVWGSEQLLQALWSASIASEAASGRAGGAIEPVMRNHSSIDFDVEIVDAPAWLRLSSSRIAREGVTTLAGHLGPDAPVGDHRVALRARIRNLRPVAETPLETTMEVFLEIAPR